MHLIAPTDTARTIAQHELRGAVHLRFTKADGLPTSWVHLDLAMGAMPSWTTRREGRDRQNPSFIGESEGKDDLLKLSGVFWFPRKLAIQIVVYTSSEVPGKRYENLDLFGKSSQRFYKIQNHMALEWRPCPHTVTFFSFPCNHNPCLLFAFFHHGVQQFIILHSGKCSSHKQSPILFYHLSPLIDFKIGTLYIQIDPHIHHHSPTSRAPKSWTLPPPLQTNSTLRIRRLWKRRPAPGPQGW